MENKWLGKPGSMNEDVPRAISSLSLKSPKSAADGASEGVYLRGADMDDSSSALLLGNGGWYSTGNVLGILAEDVEELFLSLGSEDSGGSNY